MTHETGQLDDSWGFSDMQGAPTDPSMIEVLNTNHVELAGLLRDTGALHCVCLQAFKSNTADFDMLSTENELGNALKYITDSIKLDPFDDDDIEELWFGNMNFSEFYLLCKELFASLHRAMSTEIDADDILVDSMQKIRL